VREITEFWRNYDSLRWHREKLVLRLRSAPTDAEIEDLNVRFAGLLESGRIERSDPLTPEIKDEDRLDLPRLVMVPHHRASGELYRLIRALNKLPSAPSDMCVPAV
jgi:hypothetical protein